MVKSLTYEQHLLLESLTQQQYYKNGKVRPRGKERGRIETRKLGLDLCFDHQGKPYSVREYDAEPEENWSSIRRLLSQFESKQQ